VVDKLHRRQQIARLLIPGIWVSDFFFEGECFTYVYLLEVFAKYGSPEQQHLWLDPLLRGEIRSAFAMTERFGTSSELTLKNLFSILTMLQYLPLTPPTFVLLFDRKGTKLSSTGISGAFDLVPSQNFLV
jgi:hypothetical protein